MKYFSYLIFGIVFFVSACKRQKTEKSLSSEILHCQKEILELDGPVRKSGWNLKKRICTLSARISNITNNCEKVVLWSRLREQVSGIDFSVLTNQEKAGMAQDYFQIHEIVAYGLIQSGTRPEDIEVFLINDFRKYKNMCFSFGDPDDLSDGMGDGARERRRLAKEMRLSWINDAAFFERHSITRIFHGHQGYEAQFIDQWHKAFGCHDPEHRVLKKD